MNQIQNEVSGLCSNIRMYWNIEIGFINWCDK